MIAFTTRSYSSRRSPVLDAKQKWWLPYLAKVFAELLRYGQARRQLTRSTRFCFSTVLIAQPIQKPSWSAFPCFDARTCECFHMLQHDSLPAVTMMNAFNATTTTKRRKAVCLDHAQRNSIQKHVVSRHQKLLKLTSKQ